MMFSRNPFPHLSPTIHVFPPSNSFLDNQKHDLHTNPFLSGDSFPASKNFPAAEDNLAQELGLKQFDNEYNPPLFWPVVKNKKAAKKDHHSKIDTAQGPRDRRVRLSTEVAKKFFYLQDLLGVDKASKTLDWLFQKSKISIDELIKRKKETSSPTATDQSEVTFMEAGTDEGRKKKNSEGKRKKMVIRKCKSGFSVNQSRAEARARARERTREKQLIVKKLDNEYKSVHVDCCSSNLTLQSRFWHSVETQSDQIGESVMEDNLSMLYGFQHNPSGHCNDLDPLEVLVSSHAATMF